MNDMNPFQTKISILFLIFYAILLFPEKCGK